MAIRSIYRRKKYTPEALRGNPPNDVLEISVPLRLPDAYELVKLSARLSAFTDHTPFPNDLTKAPDPKSYLVLSREAASHLTRRLFPVYLAAMDATHTRIGVGVVDLHLMTSFDAGRNPERQRLVQSIQAAYELRTKKESA